MSNSCCNFVTFIFLRCYLQIAKVFTFTSDYCVKHFFTKMAPLNQNERVTCGDWAKTNNKKEQCTIDKKMLSWDAVQR